MDTIKPGNKFWNKHKLIFTDSPQTKIRSMNILNDFINEPKELSTSFSNEHFIVKIEKIPISKQIGTKIRKTLKNMKKKMKGGTKRKCKRL